LRRPLGESIIKRAREKGLLDIRIHNLRQWATGKHMVTDDAPYGGGQGMVMKCEPIFAAVEEIKAGRLPEAGRSRGLFTSRHRGAGSRMTPRPVTPGRAATSFFYAAITKESITASSSIWWMRKSRSATMC